MARADAADGLQVGRAGRGSAPARRVPAEASDGCSDDGFLGSRLRLLQPRAGFRSGNDAVLLAASVPASAGESALELGLGAGVASLCLASRVAGVAIAGVERHPAQARLARLNAARNGLTLEVIEADIDGLPAQLGQRRFDHVFANPPWFAANRSHAADPQREAARGGGLALGRWIAAALGLVNAGGSVTLILAVARLPEAFSALPPTGAEVRPLAARWGESPRRVVLRQRAGSRAPFRLLPVLALHPGPDHASDRGSYAGWAESVLRDGAPLPWDA